MCDTLVDQISLCLAKYRLYKLNRYLYCTILRLDPVSF